MFKGSKESVDGKIYSKTNQLKSANVCIQNILLRKCRILNFRLVVLMKISTIGAEEEFGFKAYNKGIGLYRLTSAALHQEPQGGGNRPY